MAVDERQQNMVQQDEPQNEPQAQDTQQDDIENQDQQDVIELELDENIMNAMEKFGYTEEDLQNMPPEMAKKTINVLKSYVNAEKKMHEVTSNKMFNQQQIPQQQPQNQFTQFQQQIPVDNQQNNNIPIDPDEWDPYDINKFTKVTEAVIQKSIQPVIQNLMVQQQIQQIVSDFRSRHPEVPENFIPTLADVAVKQGLNTLDDAYEFLKQTFVGQQPQPQPTNQQTQVKKIVIPTRPNTEGGAVEQNQNEIPETQQDVFEYLKKKYQ